MTTGQLIRAARKRAGMTQKELAEKLNISYVNISQLENDQRSPGLDTLQKIASALGVPMSYLLGHTDDPADRPKTHWAEIVDFSDQSLGERLVDAFMGLNPAGQQKVADYAEDILPRYRAETAPQSTPAPQEGKDTAPTADGSERPQGGG